MRRIVPVILIMLLLISCNSTDLLTNNEIDTALRDNFKSKNDSIALTVRTDNEGAYYLLGSQDFYDKLDEKTEKVKEVYWDPRIKSAPAVMDEFYLKQEGFKNHELHSDKYHYTVHFGNTQKESYISVLKIHANEQQHYLLAVVYSLTGKSWKMEKIIPARYSFFGHNADDMYEQAKEKDAKGFTIDAFVFANGALNLIKNGGKDLVFDDESEKEQYRNSLLKELEQRHGYFPVDIEEINPIPQLAGFDMAYHQKGLHTAVHYNTWTPMDDLPALTKEYEKVKEYVAKNLTDLDQKQQFIFYRAFSMVPDRNGNYAIHGFVDEHSKARKEKK